MIANNEINENGIIFSHPPLVGPAGFLKNQFKYIYMQYGYISPT